MSPMQRLKVILNAAVTWLVAAGLIIGIILQELDPFDDTVPTLVFRILAAAGTTVGVAATIIRRVTPVLPDDRGILPAPPAEG